MELDAFPQLGPLDALPAIERMTATERMAAIARGEVHLWYCFYESLREPALLERYDALMTSEERARHRRFYFERDQHMFLLTRALVRTVLSRYAPCDPAAWRFETNAYGRPHVAGPVNAPFFNLSNTHGLVVCAVAQSERVGVDVEKVTRRTEPLEIADRFFSAHEVKRLHALPAARHRERFFSLWTLKEAYIKARGMGLAIPLGQFSYELDTGPITIGFGPKLDDRAASWRFALSRASAEHIVALAIDAPNALLRASPCVPLVSP